MWTGIFGKWHIGGNYPYRPIDRGFDKWLGLGNGGLSLGSDLWDNDRMNDRYWYNGEIVERSGFSTDVYFDEAMAFITDCKERGTAFFAYLPTNVPHFDNNKARHEENRKNASWKNFISDSCDLVIACRNLIRQ